MMRTRRLVPVMAAGWAAMLAAQGADFPRWRGENSNGSAGETSMPLVSSWDEMRVAWVSETKSPHPWNFSVVRGRTQWPRTVLANGGYCEPTVYDGKVYVSIYRPSGTKHKPKDADKWQASSLPAYTLVNADEVIVCLDAATGRTLWEAVWPETEANRIELYGGHNNLCIAGGKVFAIGNTGKLYCADAKTGKRLWMTAVQGGAPATSFPEPPPPKHPLGGSLDGTTYNCCPVAADGVVVTGGMGGRTPLSGFDAATGKRLWTNPKTCGGLIPPIRWVHEKKEYLICAQNNLQCLEPKTGEILWEGAALGGTGHDSATPAVAGDLLVINRTEKTEDGKSEQGWVCHKLSPTGAKKVWSLDPKYKGVGYIAPVIHRGYAWLSAGKGADADCEEPPAKKGAARKEESAPKKSGESLVCVAMATGKVVSVTTGVNWSNVTPGPLAMGDLFIYQTDKSLWFVDIRDPAAPKFLGDKLQPAGICCSATAADGFVFFRGAERLVNCLDARKPEARPPASTRQDDPANARYELALEGALKDGGSPTLFLGARGGAFPQAWAIAPSDSKHPDVLEPGTLQLKDGELSGQVRLRTANTFYDYRLRAAVRDGKVTGEYEDCYRGVPVKDAVTGTMLAPAGKNALLKLSWSRNWCNGAGMVHNHNLFITVAGGKVTEVKMLPERAGAPTAHFDATVLEPRLVYENSKLTGSLSVDLKGQGLVSGRYELALDLSMRNNLFHGKVEVKRGGETSSLDAWGDAAVPETEPVTPRRAVYWVDLPKSVRFDNDTAGWTTTRLYFQSDGEKMGNGVVTVRGTATALNRVDVSGLRVEGNRVKGRVQVFMKGDGYLIRLASTNFYDLDLSIEGTTVTGGYEGVFDVREAKRGKVLGTYANEKP